jgi:hypothetical protein
MLDRNLPVSLLLQDALIVSFAFILNLLIIVFFNLLRRCNQMPQLNCPPQGLLSFGFSKSANYTESKAAYGCFSTLNYTISKRVMFLPCYRLF